MSESEYRELWKVAMDALALAQSATDRQDRHYPENAHEHEKITKLIRLTEDKLLVVIERLNEMEKENLREDKAKLVAAIKLILGCLASALLGTSLGSAVLKHILEGV